LTRESQRSRNYFHDRDSLVDEMRSALHEGGLAGFEIIQDRSRSGFWPDRNYWPAQENSETMVTCLGFVLTLLAIGALFGDLGIRNADLGKLEWDSEWLFSFPVSSQALFGMNIIEYSLLNFFCWAFILPYLFVVFWSSGYGWWGLPLALLGTACISVILASIRVIIETWLRKTFSRKGIRNFQAVFTVIGIVSVMGSLAVAMPGQASRLLQVVKSFPGPLIWSPISLPILWCKAQWIALSAAVLAVACASAMTVVSTLTASRLVREGLIREPGPHTGRRARTPLMLRRQTALGGIIGKDVRLLLRNRALMTQIVILPALVIGFQFLMTPLLPESIASDFRHAATLALGVGLFILLFAAAMIVAAEADSLWLLFTFPRPIRRTIVQKTKLWTIVALAYGTVMLGCALALRPSFGLTTLWASAYALIGIVIYAYIASGLAVLMTDPFERDAQFRVQPEMSMLLMLLGGMHSYGIYAPSIYGKVVVLALSSLLAYSIWQNAMTHLPYILDPTQLPPHRIGLSDGIVVSYAFFVIQGLILIPSFALHRTIDSSDLALAYTASAVIVALGSALVFRRLKVPRLFEAVGLKRSEETTTTWTNAIKTGLFCGLLAAVCGVLYLRLIDLFQPLGVATHPVLSRIAVGFQEDRLGDHGAHDHPPQLRLRLLAECRDVDVGHRQLVAVLECARGPDPDKYVVEFLEAQVQGVLAHRLRLECVWIHSGLLFQASANSLTAMAMVLIRYARSL